MSNEEDTAAIAICRACMNECIDYKSIHKQGVIMNEVTTLAIVLSQLTNLEFPQDEKNLPTQMCISCVQALAKAYNFRKMVLRTNAELRHFEELAKEDKERHSESSNENTTYKIEVTKHLRSSGDSCEEANKGNYESIEFITNDMEEGNGFVTMTVMNINGDIHMESDYQSEEHENEQQQQETEQEQQDAPYMLQHLQEVDHDDEVVLHEVVEESELNEITEVEEDVHIESDMESQMSIVKIEENTIEAYEISLEEEHEGSEEHALSSNDQQSQEGQVIEGREVTYYDSDAPASKAQYFEVRKGPLSNLRLGSNHATTVVQKRKTNLKREKNPNFQCKICGKQLSNAGSFKYHMQLHSDIEPFLCSLCGDRFKTRNAYEGHMSLHNPHNPNTCDICGKTYRQASSLRSHMLTHTGEKPFQCEICGKGLTQKSGYKKHMLTHTDEKPHECDVCGREFRYSSNLLAHKRLHNASKTHRCSECAKSFVTAEQLERHRIMSHSQEYTQQCDLCPKRFRRRLSLLAHRNSEHNVENFESKLSKSNVVEML